MTIDLEKCLERPLHVDGQFDLGPRFAGHGEIETLDPVHAAFDLAHAGSRRFVVRGGLEARATAYCVRCLESFPVTLERRFDLAFMPASSRPEPGSSEAEMAVDEVAVSYYEDDRIEVLPVLEEQLNLAFPMRFLCAEACRGLCQHCGANRNQRDCSCTAEAGDPRLAVLKSLLG